MKALTICQPYAELIARGDKRIENRSWPTAYRGPIAIHAGKSRAWLGDDDEDAAEYGVNVAEIPFGAVVAIANLTGCLRFENLPPALESDPHANGPWCWLLQNIRRITPVPYRGAQGLFEIPDSALKWAQAQTK